MEGPFGGMGAVWELGTLWGDGVPWGPWGGTVWGEGPFGEMGTLGASDPKHLNQEPKDQNTLQAKALSERTPKFRQSQFARCGVAQVAG